MCDHSPDYSAGAARDPACSHPVDYGVSNST